MTDREDRLLDRVDLADEPLHLAVRTDVVRRQAAGNQERIEIVGRTIGDQLFGSHLQRRIVEAALPADPLARALRGSDDRHDRTGRLERTARLLELRLFESIADECRDALSLSWSLLHGGEVFAAPPAFPSAGLARLER